MQVEFPSQMADQSHEKKPNFFSFQVKKEIQELMSIVPILFFQVR